MLTGRKLDVVLIFVSSYTAEYVNVTINRSRCIIEKMLNRRKLDVVSILCAS